MGPLKIIWTIFEDNLPLKIVWTVGGSRNVKIPKHNQLEILAYGLWEKLGTDGPVSTGKSFEAVGRPLGRSY